MTGARRFVGMTEAAKKRAARLVTADPSWPWMDTPKRRRRLLRLMKDRLRSAAGFWPEYAEHRRAHRVGEKLRLCAYCRGPEWIEEMRCPTVSRTWKVKPPLPPCDGSGLLPARRAHKRPPAPAPRAAALGPSAQLLLAALALFALAAALRAEPGGTEGLNGGGGSESHSSAGGGGRRHGRTLLAAHPVERAKIAEPWLTERPQPSPSPWKPPAPAPARPLVLAGWAWWPVDLRYTPPPCPYTESFAPRLDWPKENCQPSRPPPPSREPTWTKPADFTLTEAVRICWPAGNWDRFVTCLRQVW